MRHSNITIKNARIKRANGLTYQEISEKYAVSRSTAREWCKDVVLNEEGSARLKKKIAIVNKTKIENLARINKEKRAIKIQSLLQKAQIIANGTPATKELSALLCAVMFWCEGGKDTTNGIRFINSDPIMIEAFLAMLRDAFDLDESKFRALVHLHDYHDPAEQMTYWSTVTKIPLNQFYPPYLKPHTGKNKKEGYPGCISIRYNDSSLGKLLQMVYTEFGDRYRGVR